jgi:PAS domain S-box-containing protein
MDKNGQAVSSSRHAIDSLGVLGCFVLIVVVAIGAWLSYLQYSDSERAFQSRLARDTALVLEVHARDTLASVDDAVRRIKENYEVRGAATDIRAVMDRSRSVAGYAAVASVADSEGRIVLSTLPVPPGTKVAEYEHFLVHVARDTGAPFIGKPQIGRITGKWSFHVTRRINRPDGSFGGIAIVAVDFSYWQRLLQEGDFSGTSAMVLIGLDGVARASHSSRGSAEELRDADWGFLLQDVKAGNSSGVAVGSPGGGERVWAYRALPGYPMVVAVGIDAADLEQRLGTVRAGYAFGVAVIAILAVLLTVGLLQYLSRQRANEAERLRIAGVLQQSEERYRLLFDANPLPVMIREDVSLKILAVNQAMVDKFGYDRESLIGMKASQLHSEATREDLERNPSKPLLGTTAYARRELLTRDGGQFEADVATCAVMFDGKPSRLIVINDVNAQVSSERAVRESEERLRTIAEHIGEGLALYDRDDRLIFFNEPYRRMQFSATLDLRPGLSFESLARDRARALAEMGEITDIEAFVAERVAFHRNPGGGVIERRRPDGGYHLIREGHTADGQIVVSFVDITELKQREAELRESENRFRAMFEQAGLGITLREARNRHSPWLAVNDRFCSMTGYSRDELARMSTADITPPEDNDNADLHNAALADGNVGSYSREKRIRCKDGSWLWVDLTVTAVPDPQGKPDRIIATYQDIDARKQAEERLRESEGRLRAIIAAEPECVAIVAPDGELMDMNPAGLRMLEASSLEEMRRWPFVNQVAPQFRRAFVRLQHSVLEGNSGVLEFEAFGIHGKRCWLEIHAAPLHDVSGSISALLGIARDVTERRLAREALAAERNLLRTVIDNLPDRIRAKDRDLRFMLANAAWMRTRAPDREDVSGLHNSDLLPPDLAAKVEAEDRAVLESGQPSPLREVMVGPAENPHWYVTAKMPLRDSAGNVTGLVAISRDVTDFKRRSLEVEKLNMELEARVEERTAQLTSANEELEAFASSVSHDLRAPLRHIDGMAAALLEDCGEALDETGRDYLARIRGASQRMAALIEDLLRLSRVTRTALHVVDVDLSEMAGGIVDDLRREYPGRAVAFRNAPQLLARGDAGLLRAALMNLLQNAWKFTGKKEQARIDFGAEQRSGATVYFVRDNGAGFDMEHADRLFGTFQRLHTEREFPGTGIGLATVRRIMRRHGGDVWADAVPDNGATFYFTLGSRVTALVSGPVLPATMLLAAEPAATAPGSFSILLVDDDADVLTLSVRALRPDGYEILTASNGDEAMTILRSRAVGIVVSDFSMPGMNGAQLLAQAAALYPATLRIIVSGQTMNRAMQAGLRKGEIHHYFEKQHSYEPVRACIREWVEARRQE